MANLDIYKINKIDKLLENNTYPGRGIIVGRTEDSNNAVCAYFIMGRSKNSRNRKFIEKKGELFTKPFDESKVEDPRLIIYAAIRQYENNIIVTNGNQTDTIYEGLKNNKSFSESLECRKFEPDKPNFTPRISSLITLNNDDFNYQMSILKSIDKKGSACVRYTYQYPAINGLGHFIHTYMCDGTPIPTFQGEPERVQIDNNIEQFSHKIWNSLNEDNKISLYVRYIDIKTKKTTNMLINKNV